ETPARFGVWNQAGCACAEKGQSRTPPGSAAVQQNRHFLRLLTHSPQNGRIIMHITSFGSWLARPRMAQPKQETTMRLLVIEDDLDLNRQLATPLTEAGYVVDRAF